MESTKSSRGRLAGQGAGLPNPMAVPGRERRRLAYARRGSARAVSIDTVPDRTPQCAESPVASRLHQ
jgi:hypothetical protein